jgi:hypothetical protein
MAHNGAAATIVIDVVDLAHPKFDLSGLKATDPAALLLKNQAQDLGDVVQYIMEHNLTGATFSLDSASRLVANVTLSAEGAALITRLLQNFPYVLGITVLEQRITFGIRFTDDMSTHADELVEYDFSYVPMGDMPVPDPRIFPAPNWVVIRFPSTVAG